MRFLFKEPYSQGDTFCYLAKDEGKTDAKLRIDPEEVNQEPELRRL